MNKKILLIGISFILSLLLLGVVNALGEPCVENGECASCEKCVDLFCAYQTVEEDLNDECDLNKNCENITTQSSNNGLCDGSGSCNEDIIYTDISFCEYCDIEGDNQIEYQYFTDLFDDCIETEICYLGSCINTSLKNCSEENKKFILIYPYYVADNGGGIYEEEHPFYLGNDTLWYSDNESSYLQAISVEGISVALNFTLNENGTGLIYWTNEYGEDIPPTLENLTLPDNSFYNYEVTGSLQLFYQMYLSGNTYFYTYPDFTELASYPIGSGKFYETGIYEQICINLDEEEELECYNNTDCSFCMKCIDNICINQTSEDLKNECEENSSCISNMTLSIYNGLCNSGDCDLSFNIAGICEYCNNSLIINQSFGEDIFADCDLYCNGNGSCYNETIIPEENETTLNSWYRFFNDNQNVLVILAIMLVICGGVIYYINKP
jgi:hypothetical protein